MDFGSIQAVFTGLQTAGTIAKSIAEISNAIERQQKVIELQQLILDAQGSALEATSVMQSLQEKVRALETQLANANAWGDQEQRYLLVNPWRNAAQFYALKESHASGEPAHFLCTSCFHTRRKSIPNPVLDKSMFVTLACPVCRSAVATGYRGSGVAKYAESYAVKESSAT